MSDAPEESDQEGMKEEIENKISPRLNRGGTEKRASDKAETDIGSARVGLGVDNVNVIIGGSVGAARR